MLTREILKNMKEDELRENVLKPLFITMGFKGVSEYHGTQELGKDIVMWKEDETGSRENYAIVAKASRITGDVKKSISEIRTQIEQCFGSSYNDPVNPSEQVINKCWIVSSKEITMSARKALTDSLKPQNLDRLIRFIDGDELWQLIERYLIQETYQESVKRIQQISDSISPYYITESKISNKEHIITVEEKYPGASNDQPITFTGNFIFPNTPEGKKFQKEIDDFFRKGSPDKIVIEKPFFDGFEPPEFIKKMVGDLVGDHATMIKLVSNPPKDPIPVRIEFNSSDGTTRILEYVNLIMQRQGIEEIVFINQNQNIPVQVIIILNSTSKTAQITLNSKNGVDVKQWFDGLLLKDALAKEGTIVITRLDDGTDFLRLPIEEQQSNRLPKETIELLNKLVFIQEKTQSKIYFPPIKITKEDIKSIDELMQILTVGKLEDIWNSFSVKCFRDGIANVISIAKMATENGNTFVLESEMTSRVFDTEIPIGPGKAIFENAIIENSIEDMENFLASDIEKDILEIQFRSNKSNSKRIMFYKN
jgi:hypothetical protein